MDNMIKHEVECLDVLFLHCFLNTYFSSIKRSNTDLGDADLEMTIVRGIQYNLPSGTLIFNIYIHKEELLFKF